MARSESESEFDRFVQSQAQNAMQARGAVSKFRPVDLPPGTYYGRIMDATRSMTTMKEKNAEGKETGNLIKCGQVDLKVVFICDADAKTPVGQREYCLGQQGFVSYRLVPGNQDSWDRCYADLDTIGVPTRNFVPTPQQVQQQGQLTLDMGLEMITRGKPFCKLTIRQSTDGQYKNLNYGDAMRREDIEKYLGHPLDEAAFNVTEAPRQELPMTPQNQQYQVAPGVTMNQGPGGVVSYQPTQQPPFVGGQVVNPPMMPQVTPTYPQPGARFAGNQSDLEFQPDGTWFDKASKNFYSQTGEYVNITPTLPQPPMAPPALPMPPAISQNVPPVMPQMQPQMQQPGGIPIPPQMPSGYPPPPYNPVR